MQPLNNTLVIGGRGFIGHHFGTLYKRHFPQNVSTHYRPLSGYHTLDLRTPHLTIDITQYTFALIASGLVHPAECEKRPELSYAINVEGIFSLCRQLIRHGVTPIILSSGYVFDGERGGYDEEDDVFPRNVYGFHKHLLETKLEEAFPGQSLIIRIAKVYGLDRGDGTLLDEMAAILAQGQPLLAATDQVMSPICIHDLMRAVTLLQHRNARGIFHVASPHIVNRYSLAHSLAQHMDCDTSRVQKISLADLPSTFYRAKNTTLSVAKLVQLTGMRFESLEQHIKTVATHYSAFASR